MTENLKPSPALPIPGTLRGLSGDKRIIARGLGSQVIDLELQMPRPLLIVVTVTNPDDPTQTGVTAEIETSIGVNRAPTEKETIVASGLSRVALARSVTVVARLSAASSVARMEVTAVVVPIDVQVPASLFGNNLQIGTALGGPGGTDTLVDSILGKPLVVVSEVAQTNTPSRGVILAAKAWKGCAIYNNATSNLRVRLGDVNDDFPIDATSMTIEMVPNSYYETPFGYSGPVAGLWLAAGAGRANVTVVVS